MGQFLSKRSPRALIQHRAEKIISNSKPVMHPLYPTEEKILNRIRSEHPELTEKIVERRMDLEENVRKFKIVSQNAFKNSINKEEENILNDRSLPSHRAVNHIPEFGFYESADIVVRPGKILFGRLLKLLQTAHKEENDESKLNDDVPKLAIEFNIDVEKTKSVITYFAPFNRSAGFEYGSLIPELPKLPKDTPETQREYLDQAAHLKSQGKIINTMYQREMQKMIDDNEAKKRERDFSNDEKAIKKKSAK